MSEILSVHAPSSGASGSPSLAKAFGVRFFLVYLLLYMFPFPIGVVPYIGETVAKWVFKPIDFLATIVGERLLGMDVDYAASGNGSGDTSEYWVIAATLLIASVVVAAVWTLISRGRQHRLFSERVRMITRWYLGYILLNYAFIKVIPLQFPMPNDFRLSQPLGEFSPMGIAWAFMGASKPYVIFSGAMELIAGLLLFFRRTSTLGGLVAAGVLTNIVAMNFCYDIPVKLFSSHLLLIGLWIALPDAKRLFSALILGRSVGPGFSESPFSRTWMERLRAPAGALLVGYFCIHFVVTSTKRSNEVNEKKAGFDLAGVYLPVLDEGSSARWTHFYVNAWGWVRAREPGSEKATLYRISETEAKNRKEGVELDLSTISLDLYNDSFKKVEDVDPLRFKTELSDELLTLTPESDPSSQILLRRKDTSTYLLRSRGFRWINERPYNRP